MKGPVCVYSSGDIEVKTKSLAESIGVTNSSTKTEKKNSKAHNQQRGAVLAHHTDTSDAMGSCKMVSEELAKFAVTSVQPQSSEGFSPSVNRIASEKKYSEEPSASAALVDGPCRSGFGANDSKDAKLDSHIEFSRDTKSPEPVEEIVKKRKLTEDEVPSDFTLKVGEFPCQLSMVE